MSTNEVSPDSAGLYVVSAKSLFTFMVLTESFIKVVILGEFDKLFKSGTTMLPSLLIYLRSISSDIPVSVLVNLMV